MSGPTVAPARMTQSRDATRADQSRVGPHPICSAGTSSTAAIASRASARCRTSAGDIGTPPETKSPSMYQGVEAYPRWGPASLLIRTRPSGGIEATVPEAVRETVDAISALKKAFSLPLPANYCPTSSIWAGWPR